MAKNTASRPRNAASGEYGAAPYTRAQGLGETLLQSIEAELGDADFFTREDLLHISAFGDVSTITRYSYVGEAVHWLVDRGELIMRSRTEICLRGRARRYRDPNKLLNEYHDTVLALVETWLKSHDTLTVMQIVTQWRSDEHLTENVKRVTVRNALRVLAREGHLRRGPNRTFGRPQPSPEEAAHE